MSGVNKAIIVGNVGKDPEVRFTGGGQAVCNFTVATTESWKDKGGQKQERVDWHRIVVWGKLAELCGEYLKKGRQCYVEGRLQTREWEKDGKKQFTTEIVASNVVFIGGEKGGNRGRQEDSGSQRVGDYGDPADDGDIPFDGPAGA